MKSIVSIIASVFFSMVILQSCSVVYYNAKEQSAYIPNTVNQDLTIKSNDYSNTFLIGLNHFESQSNFRINTAVSLQSNLYLSKGLNQVELGASYRFNIYKTLHFDATSGIGFGDMNYNRARGYTDGTGGSSYDKYYKKNESIHYHNYRAYFSPSFLFLFNGKMKLFLGARISYINFSHFDYTFKNEQSGYGPEVIIENISIQKRNIEKLNIEPHISFHIPYKKVGFFCQAMYYGPLGTNINVNNYNIMSRVTIPVLISMGITINPNFSKSN